MAFLKQVCRRLRIEKVLWEVIVDTDSVRRIFNNLIMLGKVNESHRERTS